MTRVRLELYASKLKNVAGTFKGVSDPFAVVTLLANDPTAKPRILGQTEVIKNTLSPRWTTSFELDYEIGTMTRVNIGIYDEIRKAKSNKPMGSAMFEVGEVLGARGNTKAKRLRNGGTLFCRVTAAGGGGAAAGGASAATAAAAGKLHLQLQGQELKNVEGFFGKSDPFFEVHAKVESAGGLTWIPVFRSKHVESNLNPQWEACSLSLDRLSANTYDMDRPVQIQVWDWQKNGKHQAMGSCETSVNGLVTAQIGQRELLLKHKGKEYGKIRVIKATVDDTGGPPGGSAATAATAAAATPAPAPGFASALDPPSIPSSSTAAAAAVVAPLPPPQQQQQQAVAMPAPPPERMDDSHVPGFASALDVPPPSFSTGATAVMAAAAISSSSSSTLPSSATSRPAAASAPFVPATTTATASSFSSLPPPMMPPAAAAAAAATAPAASMMENKPTFVDYLSGGCELELCIAIDFTGSNGDPRRPGTLHYIHPNGQELNDYEKALTAVGSVVARYDSDQTFPVYGFGAKYGGIIQHCFQVGSSPTLAGLPAVLEGYRSVFRSGLVMSGPTVFSEVIGLCAATARSSQETAMRIGKQSYKILLILTDGAVSNVEETKQALQNASDAPLSIVIVGIGKADFSAMRFLDDFQVMSSNGGAGGNHYGRDICQFVEFSKFAHDKAALTKATLEEIPTQLVDYFTGRGIKPLPPISGSQISLAASDADEEDIDLTIEYNEEGEISLANEAGAVYDDTKYGNMTTYAHPAPVNPTAGTLLSSSSSSSAPYQPSYSQNAPSSAPFVPGGAHHQLYQSSSSSSSQAYNSSTPYIPGGAAAPAPPSYHQQHAVLRPPPPPPQQQYAPSVAAAPPPVFHVQLPPNTAPGMQLQVQNPVTGQQMIVVIPQGVSPGGKFAVQY